MESFGPSFSQFPSSNLKELIEYDREQTVTFELVHGGDGFPFVVCQLFLNFHLAEMSSNMIVQF